MEKEVLLSVQNLEKEFRNKRKCVRAVNGVSLDIYQGETFGLVGESGCGKSTLGNVLVNLQKAHKGKHPVSGKGNRETRRKKKGNFAENSDYFFRPLFLLDPKRR